MAERFVVIPEKVLYDPGLKAMEKLLYGEIASLTSKDGYCFATNDYFAKRYGCSKSAISHYISSLVNHKHIRLEPGETGRRIYIIIKSGRNPLQIPTTPLADSCNPPLQIPTTPLADSCNHNNTVNKKTKNKKNNRKNPKKTYGQYQNVLLSDDELQKLQSEFPHDWESRIENVSGYCASHGKTYKDYLATIRNWARKDGETNGRSVKTKLFGQADGIQPKVEDFEGVIREAEERRTAGAMGTMSVREDSAGKSLRTPADRPWEQHKL